MKRKMSEVERLRRRIDELSLTAKALRESEMNCRRLFDQSADAVVVFDPETLVMVDFNDEACRRLGYSRKEFSRLNLSDLEMIESVKQLKRHVRKIPGDRVEVFETKQRTKHGAVLDVEVRTKAISIGGKRLIQGVWRDITGRKRTEAALRQSEERFRVALKNSVVTVFSQDRDLRYTWAYNPSRGFTLQSVLGKREDEIYAPEDAAVFTSIKRRVMATGVGRRDEVVTHRPAKAGGDMVHDMTTEPLRNGKGKIVGVTCAAMDITGRKRMEKALQAANEGLEAEVRKRTRELQALAGDLMRAEQGERRRIAHILHEDLQQQLAAMKFLSGELREQSRDPVTAGLADRLLSELDQAIQVTRTLSADLRPPVLNQMSMGKCIQWIAADAVKRLGLGVKVSVKETADITSEEIRVFAFDAIRELLLNVIKHAQVRKAEVSFHPLDAGRIRIQVRDRGVGFDSGKCHMARGHLGLFSIRERAELLGGRFEATSRPGNTCVTLILPSGKPGPDRPVKNR